MNNTVKLSGKGWAAHIFFIALLHAYPDAKISHVERKWWQSTYRYEMRLQNVGREDIVALQKMANREYPGATAIKMEVF